MLFKNLFKFAKCFWFPLIVFFLNFIFLFVGWYDFFPSLDIPMHFIGGVAIAFSFLILLNTFDRKFVIENKAFRFFAFFIVVFLAALFWELGEFLSDNFFGTYTQLSLFDTLGDLFFGVCGGLMVAGFRRS